MTFDTHLSMTTHKMGEYRFSEEVKFQCLRNTSSIAVKLSEWTCDVRRSSDHEYSICRRTMADIVHEEEAYLSCSFLQPNLKSMLFSTRINLSCI